MPEQRGVSGFWLKISALENARTKLIGALGAKDGMLAYGVWVRLFTWQYETATPITGPEHVARLTNLNVRTAERIMGAIARTLPQSFVNQCPNETRLNGAFICKRTMQVLEKVNKKQGVAGAADAPKKPEDPDPDPDLDLLPSLSPSQVPGSGGSDKRPTGKKKSKPKEKSARFQRPTAHQVAQYCAERNNQVDPQAWMAHYEANGFKVGKNPMRDWKAAVRTWERNGMNKQPRPKLSVVESLKASGWMEDGRTLEGECSDEPE